MAETTRITARPTMRGREAVLPTTVARQGSYLTALPVPNGELNGLLQGLSALNPRIQEMQQAEITKAAKEAEEQTLAAAARAEDPQEALTGNPIVNPVSVPPALAADAGRVYAGALASRAGVKIKSNALQDYSTASLDPAFSAEDWLAKTREGALQGVQDPTAVVAISRQVQEVETMVREAEGKKRLERIRATGIESVNTMLSDVASAEKTPEAIVKGFHETIVPYIAGVGLSRNDAAASLLQTLQAQSVARGGLPEAFDAFTVPGPDGKSIAQMNPELGLRATQARAQAVEMRDQAIAKQALLGNADLQKSYVDDLQVPEGLARITWDRIRGDTGPGKPFSSDEQAAAMWARKLDAEQRLLAKGALTNYSGPLWMLDPSKQNDVMDARMQPQLEAMVSLLKGGKAAEAAAVAGQLVDAQAGMASSVPWGMLKRFADSVSATTPSEQGPTPDFKVAAALYSAMSKFPGLRDKYFDKEDVAAVLSSYTQGTAAPGSDPLAAYQQAYAAISPAAKKQAADYIASPAFKKLQEGETQKWVSGSSMNWLRMFGTAGRPENVGQVGNEVADYMRGWRQRHPFASEDQAAGEAEAFTKETFVMDATSRQAVKVPRGMAGEATQAAISDFTARVSKALQLGARNDANWSVVLQPVGDRGDFNVYASPDGRTLQMIQPMNLDRLMTAHQGAKHWTTEEAQMVGPLKQALAAGNYAAVDPKLLAKAEALKEVTGEQLQGYKNFQVKSFKERLMASPRMDLGTATSAALQHIPSRAKVDPRLTASLAQQMAAAMVPGVDHQGLAASLITMGEGAAPMAYDDPARGAGRNIGMGYNLKANAKTAESDLKRAGVPQEHIQAVIAGTRAMLPDQMQRLLQISLPRYEKEAQEVADATAPDLWKRLDSPQKAVLIDIAYQTGDVGKFKKALAALAADDQEAFRQEVAVFYTNASGQKVEDTRRGGLRASVLAGRSHWAATIEKYGALPTTRLSALTPPPK